MAGEAALVGYGARLFVALATRPRLLPTAVRQFCSLAPDRWWATAPHLPLPPRDYLAFRTVTATGDGSAAPPSIDDTITWLEWCRSMRSLPRR